MVEETALAREAWRWRSAPWLRSTEAGQVQAVRYLVMVKQPGVLGGPMISVDPLLLQVGAAEKAAEADSIVRWLSPPTVPKSMGINS